MIILNIDFLAGEHIDTAAAEAVAYARKNNVGLRFSFNGVRLFVHPRSTATEISAAYDEEISTPNHGSTTR